ncbi:ubiquitin carboxyl-terminal hydrolase, family 1 protein [Cardiosporidium cionae]|uniref:Ubiquitin carboxyl-terminal hydrolase n=1 Tax=Cardiosporidium cionae TaxID=476202 RepID=A0ABQ7J8Q0_9APIC|nr:ubiquitin carboxyl-terminal hydrolase, family 1 protein [Cardiosporidium cionae]|eukprot:KAF8820304.1 ubiquitin carboxyl-terminal hydrolase, family 1 protein [Cardiosporidium cionae]
MNNPPAWCLIESDPAVFTELLNSFGAKNLEFEELFDLDDDAFNSLNSCQKVYGYIFLFKWTEGTERNNSEDEYSLPADLIFPKQIVQNACATVSILSLILNNDSFILNDEIRLLRTNLLNAESLVQGLAIAHSEFIRKAHNSFGEPSSFEILAGGEAKDAFHFVSYIPFKGKVYELDGLKQAPVCLGNYEGKDWHASVQRRIRQRIERLQPSADASAPSDEIRFNLMALVEDSLWKIQQDVEMQRHCIQRATIKLLSFGEDLDLEDEVDDSAAPVGTLSIEELSDDIPTLYRIKEDAASTLVELRKNEESVLQKKKRWHKENAFRRHDFVPFLLCALRHLGRHKLLKASYTEAKEKTRQAAANKVAQK